MNRLDKFETIKVKMENHIINLKYLHEDNYNQDPDNINLMDMGMLSGLCKHIECVLEFLGEETNDIDDTELTMLTRLSHTLQHDCSNDFEELNAIVSALPNSIRWYGEILEDNQDMEYLRNRLLTWIDRGWLTYQGDYLREGTLITFNKI